MEKIPFWQILNNYRVFPRLFSLLFVCLIWKTALWFMDLNGPTPEQAAFVSTVIATGAAFFKFYVESKPKKHDD